MMACQSWRVYRENIWVPQTAESGLQLCSPRSTILIISVQKGSVFWDQRDSWNKIYKRQLCPFNNVSC